LLAIGQLAVPRGAAAQRRAEPLLGLRFGPPLRAGLAVAITYGDHSAAAQFAGPIALAEVGVGGGRVSAGYLFAEPFATGIEMLGTVMRTWGAPSQVERNRTLAGGEVRVLFFAVNVGVGVYRPVAGFDDDKRARYYVNVGLGV
jgi:hypothetical protein